MVNPRVLGGAFRGAGHRLISLWPYFFFTGPHFFPAHMGPGLSENLCVHFGWCFFLSRHKKTDNFHLNINGCRRRSPCWPPVPRDQARG